MRNEISGLKRHRRDRALFRKAILLMAVAPVAGLADRARAAVIFSDDFSNGSTLNGTSTPGGTPTASSTSYDVVSNKNQVEASITSNDLEFGIAASSSAVEEVQAIFTSTPVVFTNVNDTLDYQVAFTDTGLLLTGASSSSQISFGLYKSGGVAPLTGLNNTNGLVSTNTNADSGGVAGWQGYVAQNFAPTSKDKIVTRPAQMVTNNTVQDLIGNGASSGSTYDTPAGLAIQTTSPTGVNLSNTQYLNDMSIVLTAAGTYSITSNLYQGTSTAGTLLDTIIANNVTGSSEFFNSIDSLAIGYRQTTSTASQLDISSINITFTSGAATPEPASLGLVGLSGAALLARRRNRRKSPRRRL
jgi:hypothetical protein